MRGLMRMQNYYNRQEAWRDWQGLAATAPADLVKRFQPPANAGWRKIDRAIAKLREAMQAQPAG